MVVRYLGPSLVGMSTFVSCNNNNNNKNAAGQSNIMEGYCGCDLPLTYLQVHRSPISVLQGQPQEASRSPEELGRRGQICFSSTTHGLECHVLTRLAQNFASKSEEWEAAGAIPPEIYNKCAEGGLLVPIAGGKTIPKEWEKYGIVSGLKAEEWDGFHDFILWDELTRGGNVASLFIGLVVGAPPLNKYGSQWLKDK